MTTADGMMVLIRAPNGQGDKGYSFSGEDLGQTADVAPQICLFESLSRPPLPVLYLRKPAHVPLQAPALRGCPETYCLLPFQGLKDGIWHDGPLVHVVDHQIQSWIPEGYPVALTVKTDDHVSQRQTDVCFHHQEFYVPSLIGSLVTAIRTVVAATGPVALVVKKFDLCSYIQWVLFAKAYPELPVLPVSELDFKQWPSVAKRVCQNLGWSTYERTTDPAFTAVDLTFVQPAVEKWENELAAALNAKSDVIPRSLLVRGVCTS